MLGSTGRQELEGKIVASGEVRGLDMNGIPDKGHTVAQMDEAMKRVSKALGERWLGVKEGNYYMFKRGGEAVIQMSSKRGLDWAIVNGIPHIVSIIRFVGK